MSSLLILFNAMATLVMCRWERGRGWLSSLDVLEGAANKMEVLAGQAMLATIPCKRLRRNEKMTQNRNSNADGRDG